MRLSWYYRLYMWLIRLWRLYMELDQVGKVVKINGLRGQPTVKIIMGIKAPRGKCFIFESSYMELETQVEAIKAFMEQHTPLWRFESA